MNTGLFSVLDCTVLSTIFNGLDADSKLRFAGSCPAFSAHFGRESRELADNCVDMKSAFLAGSTLLAKHGKPLGDIGDCLAIACIAGRRDLAEIAVNCGAKNWKPCLHLAIESGNTETTGLIVALARREVAHELPGATSSELCKCGNEALVGILTSIGTDAVTTGTPLANAVDLLDRVMQRIGETCRESKRDLTILILEYYLADFAQYSAYYRDLAAQMRV